MSQTPDLGHGDYVLDDDINEDDHARNEELSDGHPHEDRHDDPMEADDE